MPFTKQDLINADLPLDMTIEEIYNENKLGGLTELPRVTLCKTIMNKYRDIVTLEDLFTSAPNNKSFQVFQQGILNMAATLKSIHELRRPVSLPASDSFKDIEEGLRTFLPEYISEKRRRAYKYKESNEKYCRTLEMYLDENSTDRSSRKIQTSLSIDRQSFYNYLTAASRELGQMFLEGKTVGGISVQPKLSALVMKFRNDFILPSTVENMRRLSRVQSPAMRDLLAIIIDVSIMESGTVVKERGNARDLDLNIGTVKKILKKEGVPVSIDDLRHLLRSKFSVAELRHELVQFAQGSSEYERIEKDGRDYIAVRWEHLNSRDAELVRILYDNNAWGPKNAMSKEALFGEWNRRASLAGKQRLAYVPQCKHWRYQSFRGSNYAFLVWSKESRFPNGEDYISTIVRENPDMSRDDVLAQAEADGYTRICSRRSLQAYFSNAKDHNEVEYALKDAIRVLNNTNDKTLLLQELYDRLTNPRVDVRRFRKWVIVNDKVFEYVSTPGKKQRSVRLVDKKAPLILPRGKGDYIQPQVQASSERSNSNAVDIAVNWDIIRTALLSKVAEIRLYPSLMGGLDKVFSIMKRGTQELSYSSVFYGWLLKINQCEDMTSWEKLDFIRNLLFSVEAYIDNFYYLKYDTRDIRDDIYCDPQFYSVKIVGLSTLFSFLKTKRLFPDDRDTYNPGSLELAVLKAKRTVVDGRNSLGHAQSNLVFDHFKMNKEIHDTLFIMAYIASRL